MSVIRVTVLKHYNVQASNMYGTKAGGLPTPGNKPGDW